VLTHVTCAELSFPQHPCEGGADGDSSKRLLLFTDAAVLPYPTDEQRVAQLRCLLEVARGLGITQPRVSLINCSEKVAPKAFPFTLHYRQLKAEAEAGRFGPCIVDGPLDLKTSLSPEALRKKGLTSPIEGRADALVFPDIQAGNVFYKTLTLFGQATAGMLCGALAPVVLPSRGDCSTSKFASLMLAASKA
jgi:phosphate butyryltransferase